MTWVLAGWAWAAEPERLELRSASSTVVPVTTLGGIYAGAGPAYEVVRFWAVDPDGQRVLAADFARLVGEDALATEVSSRVARRRALATPLLVVGIGGWVLGGATLLATRDDGPSALGVLSLVGGQGCVATSLVLFGTNQSRRRRLDPWLGWTEASDRVTAYNAR